MRAPSRPSVPAMDRLHPWFTRTRAAYLGAALVMAAAGWWLTARPSAHAPRTTTPVMSPMATMAAPPAAPGPLVHVVGAVRRPGVYRLRSGARAIAALRRAGGATRRADLSGLNLAAQVVDGQQVVVPQRGASPAPPGAAASPGPVRLSTATAAELEALDGIGPAIAARIVDWREANGAFGSVDDLLDVPGIGEAKLEALRDQVVP
ncbi:MAG: ComEA family DNA-binding protein [Thermoleophilia bacterium]|nr:ComEA family DNA-binding protein [Thermoleophilia bacterium]